jgi:hypothetical protein
MKTKIPFDKAIVSCDDEPTFLNFWPVVTSAWFKFFPDVEVELALVTDKKDNDPLIDKIKSYGKVTLYPLIQGIPKSNQGKICRAYHASLQESAVCSIHDIDTIPLQRNYLFDLLNKRRKNHICLVGSEVYTDLSSKNKAPMVPTTAEGYIFQSVYKTQNLSYENFVKRLIGMRVFDDKENIMNQPFTNFSDESVLRVYLSKYSGNVQNMRRDENRHLNSRIHWIDRSWFSIDIDKLFSGFYTEANMLRPMKENYDIMKPLIDYVCEKYEFIL